MPPRTVEEMAERLRLLGDMTQLRAERADGGVPGRARGSRAGPCGSSLPVRVSQSDGFSPRRRADFARHSRDGPSPDDEARGGDRPPVPADPRADRRCADLTARYPIDAVEAAELLEHWCDQGKVVRIGERTAERVSRSGPSAANSDRDAPGDRGGSPPREHGGACRRFSLISCCAGSTFIRRHAVTGQARVEHVLEQLQGYAAPAFSGKRRFCRRRVEGLSSGMAGRSSLARETGSGGRKVPLREEPRVAFLLA